jgi:glycine/serine hydroxymethyltransferase
VALAKTGTTKTGTKTGTLKCENPASKFAFKFNLYRCIQAASPEFKEYQMQVMKNMVAMSDRLKKHGGAVYNLNPLDP